MKTAAIFALLSAASLCACAYPDPKGGGNPNHFAYAGTPGSAYDVAANPPKNVGQVAYDPNQPLPKNLSADETLPPPPPPGAVSSAPLNPAPGNPALRQQPVR